MKWSQRKLPCVLLLATSRLLLSSEGTYALPSDGSASKLIVRSPKFIADASGNEGYDHREALFGSPPYGESLTMSLYYSDLDFCSVRKDYNVSKEGGELAMAGSRYILIIPRGGCTFVQKVRNAQRNGASAVIIADTKCLCSDPDCTPDSPSTECESQEPIMADDGSGADISIPSMLLFKTDADALLTALKNGNPITIEMKWDVPTNANGERVEYDLWSVPGDKLSTNFFKEFKDVAVALGTFASFTPHMYIYDGVRSKCKRDDGETYCYNLCTNKGRYCATDPDNDLDHGISGADVVEESIRRICVWNVYGKTDGIGVEFFDYVIEFDARCSSPDFFANKDCIMDAFKHAKVEIDAIHECMESSGGLVGDNPNSLLDAAIAEQTQREVVVVPAVFINAAALRGSLSSTTVLGAICAGVSDASTAPEICSNCMNGELPLCFRGLVDTCVHSLGECPAVVSPMTTPPSHATGSSNGNNGGSLTGISDNDANFMVEMLLGLAEDAGDISMCGLDLAQLTEEAAAAYADASMQSSLFEPIESCNATATLDFDNMLGSFSTCAEWNLQDVIEALPDTFVGTAIRCAKLTGFLGEDDSAMIAECTKLFMTSNPVGNAIKRIMLQPDNFCSCLKSMDIFPECELDIWPIPIRGSWLEKGTCLISNFGCPFVNTFCDSELQALEDCLPQNIDDLDCSTVPECPDSMLMSMRPPLAGMPLPDSCVRRQKEKTDPDTNLLERYEAYRTRCGGSEPDVWLLEDLLGRNEDSNEENDNHIFKSEKLAAIPTVSNGDSSSRPGFTTGLFTGIFIAGSLATVALYMGKVTRMVAFDDDARGKYNTIEMT